VGVDEVADRLYALPPEEFTAARAAAAKQDKAGAKEINAMRKPTVGAWLVNTLAREDPDLLDQLLSLGPALAEAQRSGQGDELRMLGAQRRELIGGVTQRAFELADRTPNAAAREEVESTLEAALADPATADAVRSGRLTKSLSYAGFGGVDLEGAIAGPVRRGDRPATKPAKQAPAKAAKADDAAAAGARDIAGAEARALDAAGALDDAVRAAQRAADDHAAAAAAEEQAAADVHEAERQLREARDRRTTAEDATRKAGRQQDRAEQAVKAAQAKEEKARKALDKLRRS
jgi:hypothetical protein